MITTHQYLNKYPIDPNSRKLIVGTIHPHHHEQFVVPFFYGNVLSLWKIISEAFPRELKQPVDLNGILKFLERRQISMSDTIIRCKRIKPSALDKDLVPLELNHAMLKEITNSQIDHILFTSGYGKNNAFRLFYNKLLNLPISDEIKTRREVILDSSIFGRPVKLSVLYSPSGQANTGIVNSQLYKENAHKYSKHSTPVKAFKIDLYKQIIDS